MPQQDKVLVCRGVRADAGAHIVFLYKDEREFLDVLSDYFSEGLRDDNLCVMVIPADDLAKRLKEEIERKSAVLKEKVRENMVFVTCTDFYFSADRFDQHKAFKEIDSKLSNPLQMIRGAGDMRWVDKGNFNAVHQYEVAVTERYHGRNLVLLCAYASEQLEIEQIIKLIQSHMLILFKDGKTWKISETVEREICDQEIEELEKFTRASVDRELKMIELKAYIKKLEEELVRYRKVS